MINKTDIEKIIRFKKGLSNNEENEYVYKLFSENEENIEFKKYFSSEWDNYLTQNKCDDFHLGFLLDRIHHIINKKENRKNTTAVRKILKWYSTVAAILIPLMMLGGILFFQKDWKLMLNSEGQVASTLVAPLGARVSFSLPDGTKGWLNSGSSLEYSLPFNNNRNVNLIGEAWFNVAHDKSHPFEVSAGKSKVKVLGTKFNLNAFPDDEYIEVVLQEGKVEFSVTGSASSVQMKPNERLTFSDGAISIGITDASIHSAWTEGKLVFKGEPMMEVIRRIERWYNVDVELKDEELESYIIRGTFQDDSLEDVFRYLSMTSPINYHIIDRKILSDGTYQKKKVLLFKKEIHNN